MFSIMSSQGFETSYEPTPKMIFLFSPSREACPLLNILSSGAIPTIWTVCHSHFHLDFMQLLIVLHCKWIKLIYLLLMLTNNF